MLVTCHHHHHHHHHCDFLNFYFFFFWKKFFIKFHYWLSWWWLFKAETKKNHHKCRSSIYLGLVHLVSVVIRYLFMIIIHSWDSLYNILFCFVVLQVEKQNWRNSKKKLTKQIKQTNKQTLSTNQWFVIYE